MSKPCEYCGADLPRGIDKPTRRIRSHHFASCVKRPKPEPVESRVKAYMSPDGTQALPAVYYEAMRAQRPHLAADWVPLGLIQP